MFTHENIIKFWDQVQGLIYREEHRDVIIELLQILDGPAGDGPCLDANSKTTYWPTKHPGFLALRKVDLRRHAVDVAQEAAAMRNSRSGLYALLIIAALGHDLGKIRGFRWVKKGYTRQRHAEDAAIFLEGVLCGRLTKKEAETVITAVRHHHGSAVNCELMADLKEADELARIREGWVEDIGVISTPRVHKEKKQKNQLVISGRVPDANNIRIPWFTVKVYLWALKRKINILPGVRAFSMRETCYFHPSVIWETLKELAAERNWLLIHLIEENPERKQDAQAFIVRELRWEGLIQEGLLSDERFYCRKFTATFKQGGTQDFTLVPVKTEAFTPYPETLEKLKRGTIPGMFREVRIARGQRERG